MRRIYLTQDVSVWRTAFIVGLVLVQACKATRTTDRARLSYAVGPAASDCLDSKQLQKAVANHLGYDPFASAARRLITVRVGATADGLAARIVLRAEGGKLLGSRVINAAEDDCRELGAAVALAISMALDPQSVTRQKPRRAIAPAPKPRPLSRRKKSVSKPASRPVKKQSRKRDSTPHLSIGAGGLVAVGSAPAAAGGALLFAALRWTWFSAAISGRFYAPASDDIAGGRISAALVGGTLLGCAHYRWLYGCAGPAAFALFGAGHDMAQADQATLPYVGFDLQLGFDVPLSRRLSLRPHAELLVPFTRVTLEDSVTGDEFWTSSAVSGSLGLCITGTIF